MRQRKANKIDLKMSVNKIILEKKQLNSHNMSGFPYWWHLK